jgi:hypothetical protein
MPLSGSETVSARSVCCHQVSGNVYSGSFRSVCQEKTLMFIKMIRVGTHQQDKHLL